MSFQEIITNIHPKQLFLIDSAGALLSAILLGFILVRFENSIGMSYEILYCLAAIACIFSMYSFVCFLTKLDNWRFYMKVIAIANLSYCCLTIGIMMYLHQKISIMGWLYFGSEMLIIATLAIIELKTATK
jgi:hypothetical protein